MMTATKDYLAKIIVLQEACGRLMTEKLNLEYQIADLQRRYCKVRRDLDDLWKELLTAHDR